jgi:hypothetical protein
LLRKGEEKAKWGELRKGVSLGKIGDVERCRVTVLVQQVGLEVVQGVSTSRVVSSKNMAPR